MSRQQYVARGVSFTPAEIDIGQRMMEAQDALWSGQISPGIEPGQIGHINNELIAEFGLLRRVEGARSTNNMFATILDPKFPYTMGISRASAEGDEAAVVIAERKAEKSPRFIAHIWLKSFYPIEFREAEAVTSWHTSEEGRSIKPRELFYAGRCLVHVLMHQMLIRLQSCEELAGVDLRDALCR
ncbi:MAG: hypothetical protein AAF413_02260 [Patescibacteria group bacterium]